MLVYRDIHLVDGTNANVYVVLTSGYTLIIDAGLPGMEKLVLEYLRGLGAYGNSGRDIMIVVTHAHYDHVGGLKNLKNSLNAKVAVHREEVDYVTGRKVAGRYRSEPVEVDVVLDDGDKLYDRFTVIHTPGHTPGSICILDTLSSSLFVGDIVYEENGKLYEIPRYYSMDPDSNRKAIAKLLELEFENLLPSHGNPVIGAGREKLYALARELKVV